MNNVVKRKCDLLLENRANLEKASLLDNERIVNITAQLYTSKDKVVDIDSYKECRDILKKKEGIFSDFRGDHELIIAGKMDLSGNPEQYLENLSKVYKLFQKGKIFGSAYRVFASLSICDAGKISEAEDIIAKTNDILDRMHKKHFFLTSDEDTSVAVLLAMTDKSTDDIMEQLEKSYQIFQKNAKFCDDPAYTLSQVLTTYPGDPSDRSFKVIELFNAFRDQDASYGREYELAILGPLTDINMDTNDLVAEIIEVSEFLKSKKDFDSLSMDNRSRLMTSAILIGNAYEGNSLNDEATSISSTVAVVIAEQVTMLIIMMSVTMVIHATSN